MSNWLNPTITTDYDVFVAEMKDRDNDSVSMFLNPGTNIPVGSIRYNRTTKIFEEWSGTAWSACVIGVTGGGTGANSQGGVASSLGLGTMAYQNSNAINVTGGTALGLTGLTVATVVLPTVHNTYDIGSAALSFRRGYYASGLVIPVGVDKYVVG